jgi:hypothetical protein
MKDWKPALLLLAGIKSRINELDNGAFWPYHFPKVAATEAQIEAFAKRVGKAIPEEYLDFLRTANGWPGLFLGTDLLGTEDLVDGPYKKDLDEGFFFLEECEIPGIGKDCLLPIAMGLTDRDLFFLVLEPSNRAGEVIWFSGEVVDTFSGFAEFFHSMIAYNEEGLKDLKDGK